MNLAELQHIVGTYEHEQLELKRSTAELDKGLRTVCRMLNGRLPGFVVFGVRDDKTIVGQDVSSSTLEQISNLLDAHMDPPAFPATETIALDSGKSVIVLRVTGGTGLYTYEGRPYQRAGATTRIMPAAEHQRRFLELHHATTRWENHTTDRFTPADLDNEEIVRTVDEAIRRQRMSDPGTRDATELLTGFGLIEDGQVLNAAAVLFGRSDRLQARFPQCVLRMSRFRGVTKDEFIDNRQEIGNAFDLFVRAQRFLRDHLPVAGRIVPNLFERMDDPLYPPEALREVIANALCHRDYAVGGGAVSIAIFDDRLEVTSVGPLPFGQTVEDLLRPHPSRPWNPLIAQVFYRRGLIEQWGRGTIKMVQLAEEAGLATPEFEVTRHDVTVRFRPAWYEAPSRVTVDLAPVQREILEVLSVTGSATLSEIRVRLGSRYPERTIQNNLQALRQMNQVDLRGRSRGARWFLKTLPS